MKINILLCDTFDGLLPDDIASYESMFTDLFSSVRKTVKYETFRVCDGVLPTNLKTDEVYVITGSNSSVFDNKPWITSLLEWIQRAATHHIHMMGVCFGHQAIAQALGGKVERAPEGWGAGLRESTVVDSRLQQAVKSDTVRLLYNHHDQVTKLPLGSMLLATSDFCRNEAFMVSDFAIGIQGHPEYTVDYMRHLLVNHSGSESGDVVNAALESIGGSKHDGKALAKAVLSMLG